MKASRLLFLSLILFRPLPAAAHDALVLSPRPFRLSSPEFVYGQFIPAGYATDGPGISPPLEWASPPRGTKSFALVLVVDDLAYGARSEVQWLVYNLPPEARALVERVPQVREFPCGILQGTNDAGRIGYGGRRAMADTRRYVFRIFALDRRLDLAPGAPRQSVFAALKGHVLGQATLIGMYRRKGPAL